MRSRRVWFAAVGTSIWLLLAGCADSPTQQVGFEDPPGGDDPVVGLFSAVAATGSLDLSGGTQLGHGATCGIHRDGSLYCWGTGDLFFAEGGPRKSAESNWTDIALALGFACGIANGGKAYCWGRRGNPELGVGATASDVDHPAPTVVVGDEKFSEVHVGYIHTACALTTTGQAYCWGRNALGQVGDGSRQDRFVPTKVAGRHTFLSITTSDWVSCGITEDSDGYCWGVGMAAGGGPTEPCESSTCVPTPQLVVGGHKFLPRIASAGSSACAIATSGETYCWGSGYLGNGAVGTHAQPVAVAGGHEFTRLAASDGYYCGIDRESHVWCWGLNVSGLLGGVGGDHRAVPVAIGGTRHFASIAGSQTHMCGVTPDGEMYCWGMNDSGQLGDGTKTRRSEPVLVMIPGG